MIAHLEAVDALDEGLIDQLERAIELVQQRRRDADNKVNHILGRSEGDCSLSRFRRHFAFTAKWRPRRAV